MRLGGVVNGVECHGEEMELVGRRDVSAAMVVGGEVMICTVTKSISE